MSIEHYENFPVASWLCPPALRPPIVAIYHFARTADDIADEGDASTSERLESLRHFRADLLAVAAGSSPSAAWAQTVFLPLGAAMFQYRLPLQLLEDLLDAFEQDLVKNRYEDRDELVDYCRRSANPIGRLLLHLYGVQDSLALQRADSICTSLQLINFWQDVSRDGPRGRVYAPQADLARYGVSADEFAACRDSAAARSVLRDLCQWAEQKMHDGAPLVHQLPGRAGWELRLVVQGGLRILARIRAMDHASLLRRPQLGAFDLPALLWNAARMTRSRASTSSATEAS